MHRMPKVHLKLRGKLTLTFLAVGLVLTAINMLSTRWLQERWEQVVAERTETVRLAEALAAVSNSIFEEGFGYVLSGEPAEKKACLDKLQNFELVRRQLLAQADLPAEEARVLGVLGLSLQR